MTDVRKITPEEIAAAVSEMNRELKAVGEGAIDRIDCSPENIEQGLARLVLSLIELLRRLAGTAGHPSHGRWIVRRCKSGRDGPGADASWKPRSMRLPLLSDSNRKT